MRTCIRKMIDGASRPGGQPRPADRDPALHLASETIRLARLAASTHLILSARLAADADDGPAERINPRGSAP